MNHISYNQNNFMSNNYTPGVPSPNKNLVGGGGMLRKGFSTTVGFPGQMNVTP